ncbi:MAG: hypothetical protein LBS80_02750 [Tannerella sp.]|nr:hypothetical protein [Tannerella sp.]
MTRYLLILTIMFVTHAYRAEAQPYSFGERMDATISLGSILPVGNLQNVFTAAPAIGMGIEIATRKEESFGLYLAAGPTTYNKSFSYGDFGDTHSTACGVLSLRYRFLKIHFGDNLSLSPFAGIGYAMLSTNLLDYIDDDDVKHYFHVYGFDYYAGLELFHKHLGLFAEYHRNTFPASSRVANNFGNVYLNIGLKYFYSIL